VVAAIFLQFLHHKETLVAMEFGFQTLNDLVAVVALAQQDKITMFVEQVRLVTAVSAWLQLFQDHQFIMQVAEVAEFIQAISVMVDLVVAAMDQVIQE
jgi:hypothetical protein